MQGIMETRMDTVNLPNLSSAEGSLVFSPAKSMGDLSPDIKKRESDIDDE